MPFPEYFITMKELEALKLSMFPRRILSFSFAAAFSLLFLSVLPAHAQNFLHNSDAAVSAFAQFTGDSSGNGISVHPTKTAGGQAAFRHSYHWWLGFEGSYNYTRFSDYYSGQVYSYQHNMHEFAGSYLVQGPSFIGFQPFATVGASAIVLSPSLNGGQQAPWQGRPGLNFGVGVNRALLTQHFGMRVQYRGVYYKTPDYGLAALTTNSYRLTSEPSAGVYVKF
jgi:hypothetical protein